MTLCAGLAKLKKDSKRLGLILSACGRGKVLVGRGTRLVPRREVCQGRHYTARLERRQ
jgi:hypothetical protein